MRVCCERRESMFPVSGHIAVSCVYCVNIWNRQFNICSRLSWITSSAYIALLFAAAAAGCTMGCVQCYRWSYLCNRSNITSSQCSWSFTAPQRISLDFVIGIHIPAALLLQLATIMFFPMSCLCSGDGQHFWVF